MGETVSTLVFRPPPPTKIKPSKYFYIQVASEDEMGSCLSEGCGIVPESSGPSRSPTSNNGPHKIPAFFIRRRGAALTFIFSHGNAEDLGMMYGRMKEMARVLGVNVLAYDYTGYGLSSGQPSEAMCYKNIEAAYNYLRKERKIPANQIILYGRSLGSGPSCYLAKKTALEGESIAGLILHSPFLSIYRIVVDLGFTLVGDMFCNKRNARDVRCPVLIIHGKKDEVVPFWHGDELLRSFPPECRAEPFWVEGLGHNNIEVYAKVNYVHRILDFMRRYIRTHVEVSQNIEPMKIPEKERYNPNKSLSDSGKVLVNRTWVRHGTEIVNEAMTENNLKQNKMREGGNQDYGEKENQSINQAQTPFVAPVVSVERTTSELLQELRDQDKYTSVTEDEDDEVSAASRYITTRDSMVEDDETSLVEDGEWKNSLSSALNLLRPIDNEQRIMG